MMFDEMTEGMKLSELKALKELMPDDYKLSVRILNMLWANYSHDQAANMMIVDKESVDRFILWVESSDPDEAWS